MTTRFPPSNLPANMQDYQRSLENSIIAAENAQENTRNVLSGMRQSVASNYGLGATLPSRPGSLDTMVVTRLQDYQGSPSSNVTLQRSWTNFGGVLTVTSPAFASNISLAVAATSMADPQAVVNANYFYYRMRVFVSGAVSQAKMLTGVNFGQTLFSFDRVPPNSDLSVRTQVWGYYVMSDNSTQNGVLLTTSVIKMSSNLRATALV